MTSGKFSKIILLSAFSLVSSLSQAIVFNMAPLEFSNRAGCAELSNKPARSVFLQIDALNAGKAGFAQGLIAQKNQSTESPTAWGEKGAKNFRLWSSHLAYEIMDALLKGKLPLLQPDGSAPSVYSKAVEKCLSKNQFLTCPGMNDLLSEIWSRSKMQKPNWQELNLSQNDFVQSKVNSNGAIGCHIVRKFSALHSTLNNQQVEKNTLANIAIDAYKPSDVMDSCFSSTQGQDPRFTTVQLDVANIANDSDWDAVGFRFWHSFKLFYAWAWRNAPEYKQEFGPFQQAFTSIAFEESVMMIPNGCRSVDIPKCDSTGLSSDVIRAAKFLGSSHPAISELPAKPIDNLLSGKAEAVNSDIAGMLKTGDASAWSRDFKERISGVRSEMQRKLTTGISKLQLITNLVNVNDVTQDINAILKDPNYDKIEMYLACMEYTLAKNSMFRDIDEEILTLSNSQELQSVLLTESGKNLGKYIEYYKSLTNTMTPFCKTLEDQKRADSGTKNPDLYRSLNEWAFGIVRSLEKNTYGEGQCLENPTHPACPKNLDKKFLIAHPKQANGTDSEVVICKTSLECARTVLQSLVSVISVRRYVHAFLPLNDIMASPNLLNNFAAPTACKLYDPWKKQRDSWKLFVADLGSAFLQGLTCGAASANVLALQQDRVVGYKEVMNQDQTTYAPVVTKDATQYVGGVDYAFLTGLSCGAAVSNSLITSPGALYNYYGELSVGECTGKSSNEYVVDKNVLLDPALNKIVNTKKNTSTTCFRCTFGLSSVAKYACATPHAGQIFVTGLGIFQGVMRLISNLTDPDNNVKISSYNVDQISESFKSVMKQDPKCHDDLKHGVTCNMSKAGM